MSWARAARAWVIEDDYDSEFRYGARPIPCLHGLDVDGRVIYVGSFSKTLFPALRLGFLIVPPDLHEPASWPRAPRPISTRPTLDQAVLADFIVDGHFARHLRRMRLVYRERLEALDAAAERCCRGALRLRPVRTGLHALADLDGVDAVARGRRRRRRAGSRWRPLSAYCAVAHRGAQRAGPGLRRRATGGVAAGDGAAGRRDRGRAASLTGRVGRLTLGPRNQGGVDGQGRVPDHGQ